jgi:hypothetical protein
LLVGGGREVVSSRIVQSESDVEVRSR